MELQAAAASSSSSSSSNTSAVTIPPQARSSSNGAGVTVQQRRQGRMHPEQGRQTQLPSALMAAAAVDRPPSRARVAAAVRARLEHKLLLQEGLTVLQQYEQYLADRFGAA